MGSMRFMGSVQELIHCIAGFLLQMLVMHSPRVLRSMVEVAQDERMAVHADGK